MEPTKAAIAYRSFRAVMVRFPLTHIIIRSWQNRPQISDSASVVKNKKNKNNNNNNCNVDSK